MINIEKINFEKLDGLVPAIIIDELNNNVLMLGFMNKEALEQTIEKQKVVFFSRTKNRLWLKGETSKNYLNVKNISVDCDNDTLLIYAKFIFSMLIILFLYGDYIELKLVFRSYIISNNNFSLILSYLRIFYLTEISLPKIFWVFSIA